MAVNNRNKQFLALVDADSKAAILKTIADHYGCTVEEAYSQVIDEEAEHLLEYIVGPQRAATSVLMQRHGIR